MTHYRPLYCDPLKEAEHARQLAEAVEDPLLAEALLRYAGEQDREGKREFADRKTLSSGPSVT